jgi:transposase-like protein
MSKTSYWTRGLTQAEVEAEVAAWYQAVRHTQKKVCPRCGHAKFFDDFGLHRKWSKAVRTKCKPCLAEEQRKYREENPDAVKLVNQRRTRCECGEKKKTDTEACIRCLARDGRSRMTAKARIISELRVSGGYATLDHLAEVLGEEKLSVYRTLNRMTHDGYITVVQDGDGIGEGIYYLNDAAQEQDTW